MSADGLTAVRMELACPLFDLSQHSTCSPSALLTVCTGALRCACISLSARSTHNATMARESLGAMPPLPPLPPLPSYPPSPAHVAAVASASPPALNRPGSALSRLSGARAALTPSASSSLSPGAAPGEPSPRGATSPTHFVFNNSAANPPLPSGPPPAAAVGPTTPTARPRPAWEYSASPSPAGKTPVGVRVEESKEAPPRPTALPPQPTAPFYASPASPSSPQAIPFASDAVVSPVSVAKVASPLRFEIAPRPHARGAAPPGLTRASTTLPLTGSAQTPSAQPLAQPVNAGGESATSALSRFQAQLAALTVRGSAIASPSSSSGPPGLARAGTVVSPSSASTYEIASPPPPGTKLYEPSPPLRFSSPSQTQPQGAVSVQSPSSSPAEPASTPVKRSTAIPMDSPSDSPALGRAGSSPDTLTTPVKSNPRAASPSGRSALLSSSRSARIEDEEQEHAVSPIRVRDPDNQSAELPREVPRLDPTPSQMARSAENSRILAEAGSPSPKLKPAQQRGSGSSNSNSNGSASESPLLRPNSTPKLNGSASSSSSAAPANAIPSPLLMAMQAQQPGRGSLNRDLGSPNRHPTRPSMDKYPSSISLAGDLQQQQNSKRASGGPLASPQSNSDSPGTISRRFSAMPSSSSSSSGAAPPSLDRMPSMGTGQPLTQRLSNNILTQVDQLLMTNIPASAFEQLQSARVLLQTVKELILARENESVEVGSDVEVLSGILKTQQTFDPARVDLYRVAAAKFLCAAKSFDSWASPQYLSQSPLPKHITSVKIILHLPESPRFRVVGAEAAQRSHMMFEIPCRLTDTVDIVMRCGFAMYNELLPSGFPPPVGPEEPVLLSAATKYVLKIQGFNDYLFPHRRVFDYEFVRHAVRNFTQVHLQVVELPKPLKEGCDESIMPAAVWGEVKAWRDAYAAKVRKDLETLDRHQFTDTSSSVQDRLYSQTAVVPRNRFLDQCVALPSLQYIPASELGAVPFRVKVLGADRVSVKALPRLGNTQLFGAHASPTSDSVDLFVRVYLFHGMTPLNHGLNLSSQSHTIRYDSTAPSFANTSAASWTNNQWILPPPANLSALHLPYARLPRTTRVCFLLYAMPAGTAALSAAANEKQAEAAAAAEAASVDASGQNKSATPASGDASSSASPVKTSADVTASHLIHRSGSSVNIVRLDTARPRNEVLLGFSSMQLFDERGVMVSGKHELNVWTYHCGLHDKHYNYGSLTHNREDLTPIMRGTNKHNPMPAPTALQLDKAAKEREKALAGGGHGGPPSEAPTAASIFTSLIVQFDSFALPVVMPFERRNVPTAAGSVGRILTLNMHPKSLDKRERLQFGKILHADPLYTLTSADRELLWLTRSHLVYHPAMLPKFLSVVDWTAPPLAAEAHRLLSAWSPPLEAVSALELLDARFADPLVREYAVHQLDNRMADSELQLYLLQLTQCLKFECYHDSALSRFLLRRALASPYQIGHHLFWHLKAEMGSLDFQERFTLILETYLSSAGVHAIELRKQHAAVGKLQRIAELVVKLKVEDKVSDAEATKEYHSQLAKLNRDFFAKMAGGKFQIPLNPRLEARSLIVEKCKYMSSKKVPLWLVFENADPTAKDIYIIFKSGDDLRQDILTLQLLKIMDKIWLEHDLDMRLKPYKCIATGVNDAGEGVGMIEVVLGSDTTSGIQQQFGGTLGALKLEPLDHFLHAHNPAAADYDRAVDNFLRSCAGYCVATFILGIGDRHNGNIMVTKEGHLFRKFSKTPCEPSCTLAFAP